MANDQSTVRDRSVDAALIPADSRSEHRRSADCAAWLTAFVVGLAHTTRDEHCCLDDIEAVAGTDVELLREARMRLASLTRIDPTLRYRADVLLTRAATRVSRRSHDDHPSGG